ncbi:MAG: ABC transporter ATP-binding protein [Pseudomonadota bacterium]
MTAALAISHLERRFGGLKAIDDVSLTVNAGEVVAVVGPNGAGKSTLIQLVTGFIRPNAGTVHFKGRDITRAAPESIAALGVSRTFQTSRIFPSLSILESVMMGTQADLIGTRGRAHTFGAVLKELTSVALRLPSYRRTRRELEDKAETVLNLFGDRLWPNRNNPAFSLSYANRRRLEIARALISDPALLLLDEPAAGMNPTETAELTDLIADLHARRPELAIVLVEHKLDVVRRLASRVMVLNQGKTIVEETPEEALSDPRVIEAYLGTRASPETARDMAPEPLRTAAADG